GRSRQQNLALHTAIGGGGDAENVFRNQRPQSTHVAQHLASFDGVRPNSGALHGLGSGLQPSQGNGDRRNRDRQNQYEHDPPDQPASGSAFTRDIHAVILNDGGTCRATLSTIISYWLTGLSL